MRRLLAAGLLAGGVACATIGAVRAEGPTLAGRWTLNRAASQFPTDIGFGMDVLAGPPAGSGGAGIDAGGGRFPATQSGAGGLASFRESEEDARRRKELVDEVRNPSPHLTISQTEAEVTITDERGRSRAFHPNGRQEMQPVSGELLVPTISRWIGARLEIRYQVEQRRELRYTLWTSADPPRLTVQVAFVERGNDDTVTRVYEPTRPGEPVTPPAAAPAGGAAPGAPPAGIRASALGKAAAAPAIQAPAPVVDQGPDAALKGLKKVGVVVEELGQPETSCGLRQATIDAGASKALVDAGLGVGHNTDEDTYLYVHITSAQASPGFCVSRYDVFLYTHTTATLSYQASPVLAQVSLFHKGGLTGGPPAAHAEAVLRGVKEYTDEIAGRIRTVNR